MLAPFSGILTKAINIVRLLNKDLKFHNPTATSIHGNRTTLLEIGYQWS